MEGEVCSKNVQSSDYVKDGNPIPIQKDADLMHPNVNCEDK